MNLAALHADTQALVDQAVIDLIADRDPNEDELHAWLFGLAQTYLPDSVVEAADALIARRTALVQAAR